MSVELTCLCGYHVKSESILPNVELTLRNYSNYGFHADKAANEPFNVVCIRQEVTQRHHGPDTMARVVEETPFTIVTPTGESKCILLACPKCGTVQSKEM
jgi:hypothetical protein